MNITTTASTLFDADLYEQYIAHARKVAATMKSQYHLNIEDAEDLVSEQMLALIQIPADKRSSTGYCNTVCINAAKKTLAKLRSVSKRGEISVDDVPEPTTEHDSDKAILSRQLVDALTSEQRLVVSHMFGIDGAEETQDCETIASYTGISVRKVKQVKESAMAKMRTLAS